MAFDLSALNGVTFGPDTLGVTTTSGSYGYNADGGYTDVITGATDPATGEIQVAYFTNTITSAITNTISTAVQYTPGDGHYMAATATDFATFGYLKFNDGASATYKYYVHGFSNGALLLSHNAVLSENEVNGVNHYNSSYSYAAGGAGFQYGQADTHGFEILSDTAITSGPTSKGVSMTPTPQPGGGYYSYRYYDAAGIGHYISQSSSVVNYYNIAHLHGSPNPNPPTYPLIFTNNESLYNAPPCYAEGTRVLTVRGEVAVEDLEVGDEAVTASGGTRPVIWIGSRRVRCDIHPNPAEVNPVRIRKGAFGEGLPVRDLVVSPGHAVFVDGVLIPAHALVNGATVVQEAMDRVRYFHVELDAHDVLLAEGLPCESYLDDGNRTTFGNSPEFTALHGRLDPKSWEHACAPMVAAGPQLAEVQRRLLARAEAMGWTRVEAPDLHLMADGVAIAPVMAKANRFWFAAPVARELALASASSTLAHTLPGVTDARRLGVAVSELKLDGQPLDLTGHALGQGFHALETHGEHAWRWTDGGGRLALTLAEPAMLEVALLMVSPTWKRPAANLRLVQAG